MKFLIDTNVLVEVILEQQRATEASAVLNLKSADELFISDFSVNSIGVVLFRNHKREAFNQFLHDLSFNARLKVYFLSFSELALISKTAERFNLDFDDAYQYTLAEKYGLTIISFDKDFDRTSRGRKTPAQVLAETG
jgi:uncharacterized protein